MHFMGIEQDKECLVELRVPKCLQFEQEESSNSKTQMIKYTVLAKQLNAVLSPISENNSQMSIESPLSGPKQTDKIIESFRRMKFVPGDKIDYYTFNMNMKTAQKDKKEKRLQTKVQAKRVTIKSIGDDQEGHAPLFDGKPRALIVYPHDTHLVLVEVLPNVGEVYDEDEYCVRFVLEFRLMFGVSTYINYRGIKKGMASGDG